MLQRISPYRQALRNERIETQLASIQLVRFSECVVKSEPNVRVALDFAIDEQELCRVVGSLKIAVWLSCQRCLELFAHEINSHLDLTIVSDEKASKDLPIGRDVLVLQARDISLAELIEDDLIMSLPMVPRHEQHENCAQNSTRYLDNPQDQNEVTEGPFATLKTRFHTGDQNRDRRQQVQKWDQKEETKDRDQK